MGLLCLPLLVVLEEVSETVSSVHEGCARKSS